MLAGVGGLRADVEGQPAHLDPDFAREAGERQQILGIAAELARQVADGARAAERHAQQQFGPTGVGSELAHFVGIVGHEHAHAAVQGGADVDVALDRMGVDTALRVDAHARHELHFTGRRQVEETALAHDGADHGRMRQRLQRVVQVDARERALQLVVLTTHTIAVDDEQRRTELAHQPFDVLALEGIDAPPGAGRGNSLRHSPRAPRGGLLASKSHLQVYLGTEGVALRARRSRTATHSGRSGTSSTRIRAAPALSRERRLEYRSWA